MTHSPLFEAAKRSPATRHSFMNRTEQFRGLAASVLRMATFSPKAGIDTDGSAIERAAQATSVLPEDRGDGPTGLLTLDAIASLDPVDRMQLAHIVKTGLTLFAGSSARCASSSGSGRLRKYRQRFELGWQRIVKD